MSKVLLVEDDELLGTTVRLNLESEGFEVDWVTRGDRAVERAEARRFDLVLLDIALPGLDGFGVLEALRADGSGVPVLMLTVRGEVEAKVRALEQGADDYLTKPFDMAELLARVKALLRRAQGERRIPAERIVMIGPHEVNLETREASTEQGKVVLSEREVAVLELLVRAGGQPLTRSDILDEAWGMDAFPTARTVDNFLMRLRKLFEEDPRHPRYILTVRGVGYRLESE